MKCFYSKNGWFLFVIQIVKKNRLNGVSLMNQSEETAVLWQTLSNGGEGWCPGQMGSSIPKSIQKAQWQVLMLLLEALPRCNPGSSWLVMGTRKV